MTSTVIGHPVFVKMLFKVSRVEYGNYEEQGRVQKLQKVLLDI